MSSTIYKEALADAKKLREVAEQSAKNAIIDAVTPKIRTMIENQLVGDPNSISDNADVVQDLANEMHESSGSGFGGHGDVMVDLTDPDSLTISSGEGDVILTPESAMKLSQLARTNEPSNRDQIELKIHRLRERLASLMSEDGTIKSSEKLLTLTEDVKKTYSQLYNFENILAESVFDRMQEQLEALYGLIINSNSRNESMTEEKIMSRNRRRGPGDSFLDEAELRLILNLPEAEDDDLDGADVSVDLGEEEEEFDVDIDLSDEDEEFEEEEVEVEEGIDEWFVIDDDLLAEADDDDVVGEDDENDLEEVDVDVDADGREVDVDVEGVDVNVHDDLDEFDVDVYAESTRHLHDDTVLEISESMLKRELQRMSRLSESPRTRTSRTRKPRSAQNGGNVRELQHAVKELRGQLSESNLFNAKLLYANKLLQQEGLTNKQKVALVEALDEARSLREVRLIYKSLVSKSPKAGQRRIGESAKKSRQVLGSASRTTRSGASSKRDAQISEAKRWAVLAGITD